MKDQIYIPANPSIPSPDQYRAFIYCKASDSGKWIDVYKSSKDGNWYMYKWMDLITSIKPRLQVIHSKYVFGFDQIVGKAVVKILSIFKWLG